MPPSPAFPWVLGLSAGTFSGFFEGITSQLVGNTLFFGGMAAICMTIFTELSSSRPRKLRTSLARSSLPALDGFLSEFSDSHSWTEEGKNRLRLVGEEVMLSLLEEESEEEDGGPSGRNRRLVATIRQESRAAELEIVVASDDVIQGNIENRMAYLDEASAPEDEQELSMRILRHYASSVQHRKYYGIDVINCRVDQAAPEASPHSV